MDDFYDLENFEPNIIKIIKTYINELNDFERIFFENIPEYIDERFLSLFYNCDLSQLYQQEISVQDKLKILNDNNLEISDIQDEIALIIKYDEIEKKYLYKWSMFKSNIFESNLNSGIINSFKSFIFKLDFNKKYNEFTFNEIINTVSFKLCLHCVTKEYIIKSSEKNDFLSALSKKLN